MILAYDEIARVWSAGLARLIHFYRNNTIVFISVFLVLAGIAIMMRNRGLYAVIFADEYTYSKFSRLSPVADAPVPSYLFFSIYRYTSYCGDGFLVCARYLNTFFFLLAAPFIFLISSKVTSRSLAAVISALSVAAPVNIYTAYFMPESLYFLMFWIFSWSILSIDSQSGYYKFIISALIFSATALVKPHSLFLIPGIVLYFAYLVRQGPERAWVARWFWVSAIFVAVVIVAKLALGFALAGRPGATLFGAAYGSIASSTAANLGHYADLARLASISLAGHFLALSILFGTPLAAVLLSLRKVLSRNEAGNIPLRIAVYALVVFSILIPVVALFTASVASGGPYETPFRLHMRYYNFAYPLLLIHVSSQIKDKLNNIQEICIKYIVIIPIILMVIYETIKAMSPYTPNFIDSPELLGVVRIRYIFVVICILEIISLFLFMRDRRLGAIVFLLILAPAAAISGTFFSSLELRTHVRPSVFDEAGIFAHQYLHGDDASRLVVMGSNPGGLFRSLFYVDNPQASFVEIPEGSPADLSKVPGEKEWLLLIGDHASPPGAHLKLALNGFSLFRIMGMDKIDFTKKPWSENLSRVQGLSYTEAWGTWSDGPEVTLEFVKPLPKKLVLHLTASAFGPNIGRPVAVRIGSESAEFVLSKSPQEVTIPLGNSGALSSISFSIPNPASPKELGVSEDSRKLGVAFRQLSVEDVTQ